jgi:hypothetical protein
VGLALDWVAWAPGDAGSPPSITLTFRSEPFLPAELLETVGYGSRPLGA